MRSTRRDFLTRSGLALAGAAAVTALPQRSAMAAVPGSTRPAPDRTPASAATNLALLDQSPLLADLPHARAAVAAAVAGGASYADARLVRLERERIAVRDAQVDSVQRSSSYGIGVRVLVDGAWGFAASPVVDAKSAKAVAAKAVATAKTTASRVRSKVTLAPTPSITPGAGRWVAPFEIDPFSVPLSEKVDLLAAATRAALDVKGIFRATASVLSVREEKIYVGSDGSEIHQHYLRSMPGLTAFAVDRKSGRFASRDHEAAPMLAGWECVRDLGLASDAPQIGEDALRKLHAEPVTPGEATIILAPSNLWLTIHESIGHPTELDRALGYEANFAGTSFITPEATGKLTIGSELVNIFADRTQPGGLATTAWDDEAVPAQRWPIVEGGVFKGWQTTRDQAGWIGESASRGCSYGEGFSGVQFQRMPNVSLQPGSEGYTTEDLINATDDGILTSGRGSWSIDHQRYNFQFGGQFFWKIENGRLARPLRDVAYQANTVDFWRSCDMLGGVDTYRLGGSFNDGKGEPSQSNSVSHGCPPARFRARILNTGGDK
jgi:TldD protein